MKMKYDYSLIYIDYPNKPPKYNDYVRIICLKHGEFKQQYGLHKSGQGCPECAGRNKWTFELCKAESLKYANKKQMTEEFKRYSGRVNKLNLSPTLHSSLNKHLAYSGINELYNTNKSLSKDKVQFIMFYLDKMRKGTRKLTIYDAARIECYRLGIHEYQRSLDYNQIKI